MITNNTKYGYIRFPVLATQEAGANYRQTAAMVALGFVDTALT